VGTLSLCPHYETDGLFDYLMEVIQDKNGNISHKYKMMKDIIRGDKP